MRKQSLESVFDHQVYLCEQHCCQANFSICVSAALLTT